MGLGCGTSMPSGSDVDAAAPVEYRCPFELTESECTERAGCAYGRPCSSPTVAPPGGCVELRACAAEAPCEPGLVCAELALEGCSPEDRGCIPECPRLSLCVPPAAIVEP